MGSNANEKKYYKHNIPRGFLRRRRLVSTTDRFLGGTRMAHIRSGSIASVWRSAHDFRFSPVCGRLRVGKDFFHVAGWSVRPCVRPL